MVCQLHDSKYNRLPNDQVTHTVEKTEIKLLLRIPLIGLEFLQINLFFAIWTNVLLAYKTPSPYTLLMEHMPTTQLMDVLVFARFVCSHGSHPTNCADIST